jgi:hypothetical protein
MRKIIIITCLLALTACGSEKIETLKSPCVSTEDTCGPKRPVNNWWLQQKQA